MGYLNTANVQSALDTQLQTVVGLPTFFEENQAASAQNITPYCRSTLAPAKSNIIGIGNPVMVEESGLYQIDLFYPTAYGFTPARTMAEAIRNAFPPASFLLLPDLVNKLIVLSAWSLPGTNYNNTSAFWQFPVRVEWVFYSAV
jgi:hypothetical protein